MDIYRILFITKIPQKVHFFTFRNSSKIFELYKCDWLPTKTSRSMALFLLSSITASSNLPKTYIFIIKMPKLGPNLGADTKNVRNY